MHASQKKKRNQLRMGQRKLHEKMMLNQRCFRHNK